MDSKNNKCLVLNADYTPLIIISWKKAISWAFKHHYNYKIGVEIIDFYKDDFILGPNNKKHPVPAVVRTAKYFKINRNRIKFSRKNIFIRDNYTCQYCDNKFDSSSQLTYDHVIPKSCWLDSDRSPTNWTNIVTSCINCNRKKGNRTPKQANMTLKTLPYMPSQDIKYLPITSYLSRIKEIPPEWIMYLPKSYMP